MQKKDMCGSCSKIVAEAKTDRYIRYFYGSDRNAVPCDRVNADGSRTSSQPVSLPSPSSTFQRASQKEVVRPSLAEKVLSSKSGADSFGFTAGPANDSKMIRDMKVPPPPKQSDKAARRDALNILAGGTVNIRRGGTSDSAVNKFRSSAEKVVDGAASALAPTDKEEALLAMQAATEKQLAEVRAQKAKEADAEASDAASFPSLAVAAADNQRQDNGHRHSTLPGPLPSDLMFPILTLT